MSVTILNIPEPDFIVFHFERETVAPAPIGVGMTEINLKILQKNIPAKLKEKFVERFEKKISGKTYDISTADIEKFINENTEQ